VKIMANSQWLRCQAADPEGYRCVRFLSHQGPHQWRRCAWTDPEGYRCFLPPSHPGDHELAWFERPTAPGATRTVRYQGERDWAAVQAEGESQELALHHWFPVSESYIPGSWGTAVWVVGVVTVVLFVGIILLVYLLTTKPDGELVVVYEYRPPAPTPATQGTDPPTYRLNPVP
jgi:hypothetical protein